MQQIVSPTLPKHQSTPDTSDLLSKWHQKEGCLEKAGLEAADRLQKHPERPRNSRQIKVGFGPNNCPRRGNYYAGRVLVQLEARAEPRVDGTQLKRGPYLNVARLEMCCGSCRHF